MLTFLATLSEKGILSKSQFKSLRIALTKVFSTVDGPAWEQTAIRDVDVDDYMQRFISKTDTFYTRESLQTYKSRILRSLKWYEQFLENPGWTPKNSYSKVGSADSKTHAFDKSAHGDTAADISSIKENTTDPEKNRSMELATYPFPLTSGQTAKLSLPFFLPKEEAKRLAAWQLYPCCRYEAVVC